MAAELARLSLLKGWHGFTVDEERVMSILIEQSKRSDRSKGVDEHSGDAPDLDGEFWLRAGLQDVGIEPRRLIRILDNLTSGRLVFSQYNPEFGEREYTMNKLLSLDVALSTEYHQELSTLHENFLKKIREDPVWMLVTKPVQTDNVQVKKKSQHRGPMDPEVLYAKMQETYDAFIESLKKNPDYVIIHEPAKKEEKSKNDETEEQEGQE